MKFFIDGYVYGRFLNSIMYVALVIIFFGDVLVIRLLIL